jgi:PIN domain nuclease of toxin-antitoxin system
LDAPETLSKPLLDAMRRGTPKVASVASLWEIAIKVANGRLNAPDDLARLLIEAEFEILPVFVRHAWAIRTPPQVLKTADPFDRLLFAQAKVDGLTLATRDRAILASGVDALKA